jgi:hypothetical protein
MPNKKAGCKTRHFDSLGAKEDVSQNEDAHQLWKPSFCRTYHEWRHAGLLFKYKAITLDDATFARPICMQKIYIAQPKKEKFDRNLQNQATEAEPSMDTYHNLVKTPRKATR